MKDRETARDISNILEFIQYIKYDSTIYSNYNHNCIIIRNSKYHSILSVNDLIIWDKIIKNDKAIFNISLLNIKDSSIQNYKNNIIIINQNIIYFDKIIE